MKSLKEQMRWRVTKEDGEYVLRGKRGVIAMYEDGDINIWVLSPRIAAKIPWKPLHTYDDGADYCRKIDDLDVACGFIKARKRRQVTEAMRQKGRELYARLRSQ